MAGIINQGMGQTAGLYAEKIEHSGQIGVAEAIRIARGKPKT